MPDEDLPPAGLPAPRLVAVPNWAASADQDAGGEPGEASPPGPDVPAAGPGTAGDDRPGGDWPQRFARLVAEALAGCRPARHVLPWTSTRARSQFQRLLHAFSGGVQPRVVRVIETRPARDVIEMSVIAGFGPRTRAVALRLERLPDAGRPGPVSARKPTWPAGVTAASGGWICTDIEAA
jgi:hypothetical protein